ncbi:hypothetical protein VNO78_18592 [Psophocarpus tetragonolobus]|uniref:Uncharacterized protein n=1 Tax=Psophocarpus tetragonolobus TaxID=3891 RepID=A0AAN9XMC0_PSOTE
MDRSNNLIGELVTEVGAETISVVSDSEVTCCFCPRFLIQMMEKERKPWEDILLGFQFLSFELKLCFKGENPVWAWGTRTAKPTESQHERLFRLIRVPDFSNVRMHLHALLSTHKTSFR